MVLFSIRCGDRPAISAGTIFGKSAELTESVLFVAISWSSSIVFRGNECVDVDVCSVKAAVSIG
jgi:hypothetical protein